MPFAKVWANSVRAQNSKWPPPAMLEIISSTVWPTILHSIWFLGLLGGTL